MLLTLLDGREPAPDVLALARATGLPVQAVAFDPTTAGDPADLAATAEALAAHGVDTLHVVRHDDLAGATTQTYGHALSALLDRLSPKAVLAPSGETPGEILAHAAARARLPLATDCVALAPAGTDGLWRLTRTRAGGVLLEDAELRAACALVTVAPGARADTDAPEADGPVATAQPTAVDECTVREFVPDLPADRVVGRVVDRTAGTGGVSLATAPVVVSGGRGVGGAEGYAVLERLAALLGGAVGCSRVATNNGWRPHSDQVGLTGTKVSCDLYIACGISGATQHWVGCMDSRTILAVNTDPEAPMVARADYAVLGDVHEVLPAVVAELEARLGAADRPSGERVLTSG